jgi:hypothetical protein
MNPFLIIPMAYFMLTYCYCVELKYKARIGSLASPLIANHVTVSCYIPDGFNKYPVIGTCTQTLNDEEPGAGYHAMKMDFHREVSDGTPIVLVKDYPNDSRYFNKTYFKRDAYKVLLAAIGESIKRSRNSIPRLNPGIIGTLLEPLYVQYQYDIIRHNRQNFFDTLGSSSLGTARIVSETFLQCWATEHWLELSR